MTHHVPQSRRQRRHDWGSPEPRARNQRGSSRATRLMTLVCTLVLVSASLSACQSTTKSTRISVMLRDYSITADPVRSPTGVQRFDITNSGTFIHELMVVRAADAAALPVNADGSVNEDAIAKTDRIGEASDIYPGERITLKLTMSAGDYVLLCNRVDGTMVHFALGMATRFSVT
jgi:hypothetical protein